MEPHSSCNKPVSDVQIQMLVFCDPDDDDDCFYYFQQQSFTLDWGFIFLMLLLLLHKK